MKRRTFKGLVFVAGGGLGLLAFSVPQTGILTLPRALTFCDACQGSQRYYVDEVIRKN